jgi:hypothetical protein
MDRKSQILDRQRRMFRIALDPTRYGLTIKMIAADANLGEDSVRNYAAGETMMPLFALDALIDVLPDDLLSLLLPAGRAIVQVPEEVNHDEAAAGMLAYLSDKASAHRPDSEAGPAIGPNEDARLRKRLTIVAAVAA